MRVLLIGSGGREHALAWKLCQSPGLSELHAAPGNPGIARLGTCHPIRAEDGESMLDLARSLPADLVVVGPEAPLVDGVADKLRYAGVRVFGPGRDAARLEGSKTFAKEVMAAADVPTARTMSVARPPCVLKVDGLAAGKGVFVCRDRDALDEALEAAAALAQPLLIEELLEGDEVSVFALADGSDAVPLAPARDYKRIGDGDAGANTGGMGSYSPVAELSPAEADELVDRVHRPVLRELASRGAPFVGLLYAGLMLTDAGPKVLEFNCRFGDPETQSILPRIGGDLLEALVAAADGDITRAQLDVLEDAAVTIVLAAGQYPAAADSGTPISGTEDAERTALVFHAGTAMRDGRLVTAGGRILNVTAVAPSLDAAREAAYAAAERIEFDGMQYRRDIAERAAALAT
ncbi:MAG: phosphoribosylamine--glycine ligase [Actinomycetota bacterium]|nr:phosphoribosylamine--glycine ligase [Actinomycetota bacterium]